MYRPLLILIPFSHVCTCVCAFRGQGDLGRPRRTPTNSYELFCTWGNLRIWDLNLFFFLDWCCFHPYRQESWIIMAQSQFSQFFGWKQQESRTNYSISVHSPPLGRVLLGWNTKNYLKRNLFIPNKSQKRRLPKKVLDETFLAQTLWREISTEQVSKETPSKNTWSTY